MHWQTGFGQSVHPSWQLISHGQSEIVVEDKNCESEIKFTFDAERVFSQAVRNAGCIVGGAVKDAIEGLGFTLVGADVS